MTFLRSLFLIFFLVVSSLTAFAGGEEPLQVKQKEQNGVLYDRAVEFFTKKMPEMFQKRLTNSYKYMDLITDIFSEKEIPLQIAYLPLIESGFSPLSAGPGDAVGLWQFVRGTAKRYGLRIDSYVDERRDPVKSTHAAAEYLGDLYQKFGAWDIALAAYNAGEGKVQRMFNRGRTEQLPGATKRYVAYFLAASTVALNPESYGFVPPSVTEKVNADYREVTVNKATSLKTLAKNFNISVAELKELNPALLRETTPPYPYKIRLPEDNSAASKE